MSVLAEHQPREGRLMDDDRPPRRGSLIRIRVYRIDPDTGRKREVSRKSAGSIGALLIPDTAPLHWPPCYCPQHPEGKVIA